MWKIGTLIDCPALIAGPRPPLLKSMCMRCDLVLGWRICEPEQAGQISHGLCRQCYERELEQFFAHRAAEQLAAEWAQTTPGDPLCAPGARPDRVAMPALEVDGMVESPAIPAARTGGAPLKP